MIMTEFLLAAGVAADAEAGDWRGVLWRGGALVVGIWLLWAAISSSVGLMLVPRPTSSRMIRLRRVACFRMWATSFISTMKVLCPRLRLSAAPMRVKIRSVTPMRARTAGTKLPICAISAMRAH